MVQVQIMQDRLAGTFMVIEQESCDVLPVVINYYHRTRILYSTAVHYQKILFSFFFERVQYLFLAA